MSKENVIKEEAPMIASARIEFEDYWSDHDFTQINEKMKEVFQEVFIKGYIAGVREMINE